MQFGTLTIKNFMSFEEAKLDLMDRGLLLIEGDNRDIGGSNGSGKSSIFEAINWVLFDRTCRGLKKDEVVRERHPDRKRVGDTEVTLEIHLNGDLYKLSRYRMHSQEGNRFRAFINDQQMTLSSDPETLAWVIDTLKLDYDAFTSTVMYPQRMLGFASGTDAEQKAIIEQVLNIGRFSLGLDRAKRSRDMLTVVLTNLKSKWLQASEGLSEAKRNVTNLEGLSIVFESEKVRLIAAMEQQLSAVMSRKPVLDDQLVADYSARVGCFDADKITQLKEVKDTTLSRRSKVQALKAFAQFELSKLRLLPLIDVEAQLTKQTVCPTCKQQLQGVSSAHLRESLEAELQKIELANQETLKQIDLRNETIKQADAELAEITNLIREVDVSIQALEVEMADLTTTYHQIARHADATESWQREVTSAEENVRRAKASVSPYADLVQAAKDKVVQFSTACDKLEQQRDDCQTDLNYSTYWVTGFGNKGVKSLLLDTITPALNANVGQYVNVLTNNSAQVAFQTQKTLANGEKRDSFNVDVAYRYGGGSYKSTSGGEHGLVDVACMLALGDLLASRATAPVELRLLDEPFEALDAPACERVMQLLRELVVPKAKTVLLMSHNDGLKAMCDNCVTVVKEHGISRIA